MAICGRRSPGRRSVSRSYEVRARINQVVGRHGLRLWQCRLDTPGFDPWGKVPVRVREGIDSAPVIAAAPAPLPEAERRRKLAEHYRGDALHIPLGELDPLRAALHQVLARWGVGASFRQRRGCLHDAARGFARVDGRAPPRRISGRASG